MRLRAALLAVLCLGLNACAPESPPVPAADPAPAGAPLKVGRSEAIDDFIVVRKAGAVSVLARQDGKPAWSVPQRTGDPIVKARLGRGSVVVVRQSRTAEVYDLRTGSLRFSKENAGAIGVSWTMLFADSASCQPDCSLRGYDLTTGAEKWAGPKSLPGKVMVEPGEPPDAKYDPPGEFAGPLRAPEAGVVAVRAAEGVILLDAASGQELSRVPLPEAGMALASPPVLLEWGAPKDCKTTIFGRDLRTGEVAWQIEVATWQPGKPQICSDGWRPEITDGLLIVHSGGQSKAIDVGTGGAYWSANTFGDPAVVVARQAIITYGARNLMAFRPDPQNSSWANRLWSAEISETSTVTGVQRDFDRLMYVTEYAGSPRGIGWVRDMGTGKRLWHGDGLTPLGVDGNRVIAESPSGEISLERMVSTG